MPQSAWRKGEPAISRTITAGISTDKGRFITPSAIHDQKPSSLFVSVIEKGTFNEFILSPNNDNIAGKRTTDETKATRVAHIPPQPSDGKPVFSKNNIPINPTITVIAEKKIALPAVALVIAIAVLWSLPLRNSSLNRLTMNNE